MKTEVSPKISIIHTTIVHILKVLSKTKGVGGSWKMEKLIYNKMSRRKEALS